MEDMPMRGLASPHECIDGMVGLRAHTMCAVNDVRACRPADASIMIAMLWYDVKCISTSKDYENGVVMIEFF